jgi:hypothetical protein
MLMFTPTDNKYVFKYLTSAVSGEGLKEVYLPPVPDESEILFKEEQRWVRPEMPDYLRKEVRKMRLFLDPESKHYNPDYTSPFISKIQEWEDTEWKRSADGVWIWVNGTPTFLTSFYYFYLSGWECYFGFPDFRQTDVEITYALQYCEEDPNCFGMLLNTIRRYGKSSVMGAWIVYRTIRNRKHYSGMQGEKDSKIADFYYQMVLQPFKRLPYYFKPKYNEGTKQTRGISFERTSRKGKKTIEEILEEEDDDSVLESYLDYRPSGEAEYDGSILHTYLGEEPGKLLACSIHERWKIVKPCLRKGKFIRGKSFMATTVEFLDTVGKGGRAYKKLFYDSDFDDKKGDGRTKSGLYAFFLPGDTGYEGYFDDYGHPLRESAKKELLLERESLKDSPKDHSDLIRKYPLTVSEIFYINTEKCEFNSTVLQERRSELDRTTVPIFSRYDLRWENNKRFTKVIPVHNPNGGWLKATWLFPDFNESNKVEKKEYSSGTFYQPLNDSNFVAGVDPIDHGTITDVKGDSDDEFIDSRRSKPVLLIKRKYDSSVEGILDQDILDQRASERYQYKTNVYVAMMDVRPHDPNVFFERSLMICWLFGVSLHVESSKPGVINYFHLNGCGDFILKKYTPDYEQKRAMLPEGSPATTATIQAYTSAISTYVQYWGHTIPFRELIEDLLLFSPRDTKQFDFAVAMGWTELADQMKPKNIPLPMLDLLTIMPSWRNGKPVLR